MTRWEKLLMKKAVSLCLASQLVARAQMSRDQCLCLKVTFQGARGQAMSQCQALCQRRQAHGCSHMGSEVIQYEAAPSTAVSRGKTVWVVSLAALVQQVASPHLFASLVWSSSHALACGLLLKMWMVTIQCLRRALLFDSQALSLRPSWRRICCPSVAPSFALSRTLPQGANRSASHLQRVGVGAENQMGSGNICEKGLGLVSRPLWCCCVGAVVE